MSIAAGLDNSFPLQELPQLSLASLLLKILRDANPELDRHVLCLASAAPVTVLPTCIVPLFAVNQDDTSGYVVLLQILYAFLIRTLHCHFGCFSANPPYLLLKCLGRCIVGCVAAIPTMRLVRHLSFDCQYLTSMHKIHFCNRRRSESCLCFL